MDIGYKEIESALWRAEFRNLFPELTEEIRKYFAFPKCSKCFRDLYKKIVSKSALLTDYFGEELVILDTKENKKRGRRERPQRRIHQQNTQMTPTRKRSFRPKPIRRIFKTFNILSVDKELENYPPPDFHIEAMTQTGDKVSFVMVEFGSPEEQETGTGATGRLTEPSRDEIREAISELRKITPNEAKPHLDKLVDLLIPDPARSTS